VRELVITAVGVDRPGIVAGLTDALLGVGANLEDCRAALLRGSFAMVMAVAVPDDVDPEAARAALAPVAEDLGLGLWVGEAAPAPTAPAGERCVLSVYGADHPGIVHAAARALAERGVNIVDLSSRLVGDPPIFVLGIEADLPAGLTPGALEAALRPLAAEQRVEVHLEIESDEVM
jgi:glycine cleavage system transcriptional repressor